VIDSPIPLSIRYFRNEEKETGNEMRPTIVSGIVTGDGKENGKKAIGLDQQSNNFARASRFFVHFFAVVARLRRKTS